MLPAQRGLIFAGLTVMMLCDTVAETVISMLPLAVSIYNDALDVL